MPIPSLAPDKSGSFEEFWLCLSQFALDPCYKNAGYTVPARVLGLVYANQSEECYKADLKFPLLDTYEGYFTDKNVKIDRIIVLLTDQSQIFSSEEQRLHQKSPYWKDTSTIKPLLQWYFQNSNFTCHPEFEYLIPDQNSPGVDNWDATLSLVEAKLTDLNIDVNQEVYVSHQAGTPAISSAVQFVTIGRFKKVQFLVSNEYFDENYDLKSKSQVIESSRYQRGIQIQKAKQLINKGLPAAAKEVLLGIVDDEMFTEINEVADFFNLKNSFIKGQEFEVKSAVDRILISLDLIEIFFIQENYIQGIALLSATQETFLKAAIFSQKRKIDDSIFQISSVVDWNRSGLFLESENHLNKFNNMQNITAFLKSLSFPPPVSGDFDFYHWEKYQRERNNSLKLNNSRQFKWLCELKPDFKPWANLSWSCQYKRDREDDLRNQLLHNLLGVKKPEVINYILGYSDDIINIFSASTQQSNNKDELLINEVHRAYVQNVKSPLLKALKLFGLSKETGIYNKLQTKLQQIAESII
ncbi:hypothetical protein [Trichormus sp. NMC-1]|uniref:hypothetical protein n=1 Tax=Trichormus sp. NMC-1 TaxID=1853259 RepID=UPI0015A5DD83|nr:hypothetical protein [Trichormus sp. NMC-1]